MSAATTYTVVVQESTDDLASLGNNNYLLQLAKAILGRDGKTPVYNMVFKSEYLAPNMQVSWTETYGINFTTNVPYPGATVTFSGNWQPCGLGQSFSLDKNGSWISSNKDPNAKKNCVNIASNNYPIPVHVVVGVLDPTTQNYDAIFIDPDELLIGAHGEYQPLEQIQVWFQEGLLNNTIITSQGVNNDTYTFGGNNTMYFNYDANSAGWASQPVPFSLNGPNNGLLNGPAAIAA